MFIKKIILFIACLGLINNVLAQQAEFCEAINAIVQDAPNKFKNIRGKVEKSEYNVMVWESGIAVPGTINSRFVAAMGLFYEGAFFQAAAPTQLRAYYEKVKRELAACLTTNGYNMTFADNFSPGLSDYKKVIFMKELPASATPTTKLPPHITMEALFNKDIGKYTIVMYVFEN